jgi:tetratricopeptide (TPR) repeat protein
LKNIFLVFILLYSFSSQALVKKAEQIYIKSRSRYKNAKIAQELYKSKYYFSAIVFAKEHLITTSKWDESTEELFEELILKTGTMSFYGLSEKVLTRFKSPSLKFIAGLRAFNYKKYKAAVKYLNDVPNYHRFAPEALFIKGSALNILNKVSQANEIYTQCEDRSGHFQKQAKNKKLKRYFTIISESCVIHKARLLFKQLKYQEAMEAYDAIPKTSYRWPYILLEKAWTAYHLNDYNRTLGILVTYKTPLMSSYFFPEAEVLRAISYFKLCLWKDSLGLVNQYYNVFRPKSDELKKILLKNKNSQTYFLKMLLSPIKEFEKLNPFVRKLMTQIRKRIKFSLDVVNYKKALNEIKFLKKRKKSKFNNNLIAAVQKSVNWRAKHLNHYIKRQMFQFINDMHKFSYEMFNVRLEVLSLKRNLVYSNEKLISNRSRGSLENVNRPSNKHFYPFNGEFWGDELGEYSFGLKSNCETVKNSAKEDEEAE